MAAVKKFVRKKKQIKTVKIHADKRTGGQADRLSEQRERNPRERSERDGQADKRTFTEPEFRESRKNTGISTRKGQRMSAVLLIRKGVEKTLNWMTDPAATPARTSSNNTRLPVPIKFRFLRYN